jgi:predicted DNA-binding transcriptional regulator YafY
MKNENLICQAILKKRVLAFYYDGHYRTVEPHAYGMCNGSLQVLGYQLTGLSNSGKPLSWRQFKLNEMAYLKITPNEFTNIRLNTVPKTWSRKIAVVS